MYSSNYEKKIKVITEFLGDAKRIALITVGNLLNSILMMELDQFFIIDI
ncbi:MAG: hypothetical protein ACXAC7_01030 [Candidatus Hodarchaeales archaeon]|jgi:hypothetical protein